MQQDQLERLLLGEDEMTRKQLRNWNTFFMGAVVVLVGFVVVLSMRLIDARHTINALTSACGL